MSRVTVVGGSGDVGALIVPLLAEHHDVTVADLHPRASHTGSYIHTDVGDPRSLESACAGAEVLVYLAMGPKADWGSPGWARRQFAVNVEGLYSALRAAATQGVRHFVHASTASVFFDYLAPPLPAWGDAVDAYGLSKSLAESVCAAAVREHRNLRGISLRLVGPMTDSQWQAFDNPDHRDVVTAGSDVARAFLQAVNHTPPGYRAVMVSGDYTHQIVDSTEAGRVLHWRPLARRGEATAEETIP